MIIINYYYYYCYYYYQYSYYYYYNTTITITGAGADTKSAHGAGGAAPAAAPMKAEDARPASGSPSSPTARLALFEEGCPASDTTLYTVGNRGNYGAIVNYRHARFLISTVGLG